MKHLNRARMARAMRITGQTHDFRSNRDKEHRIITLVCALGMSLPWTTKAGNVLYVDPGATGPDHDGMSWCTAYWDLREALAVTRDSEAGNTQIRLADGVYTPAPPNGDRTTAFDLTGGLTILGGFAGCGAPDPDERDPRLFESVLSGDLNGNDGAPDYEHDDNAHRVVSIIEMERPATLDGLTITAAVLIGEPADSPSANLYVNGASCRVVDSQVRQDWGGAPGVLIDHGSLDMESCIAHRGYLRLVDSLVRIADSKFMDNDQYDVWQVGGRCTLDGCTFSRDPIPENVGWSILAEDGELTAGASRFSTYTNSAVSLTHMTGRMVDCTFADNHGQDGSAVRMEHSIIAFEDCRFINNHSNTDGGAILARWSEVSASNCSFTGNFSNESGGAAYFFDSSVVFADCHLAGNFANVRGGGAYLGTETDARWKGSVFEDNASRNGGALYNKGAMTIETSKFVGNHSVEGGGAVYNAAGSETDIRFSLFRENIAFGDGGAVQSDGPSQSLLVSNSFLGNVARFGGALSNYQTDARLWSCLFNANTSTADGGALYAFGGSQSLVVGSTFYGNSAENVGGAIAVGILDPWSTLVTSCVLWNNRNGFDSPTGPFANAYSPDDSIAILYSDIQGGWSGLTKFGTNIRAWPRFRNPVGNDGVAGTEDDDFYLQADSPCINAGDPEMMPNCDIGITDISGSARVLCGLIDMGAHESGAGDFNCDGHVDLTDYGDWPNCESDPIAQHCEAFHLNPGCQVDLLDFGRFQALFEMK